MVPRDVVGGRTVTVIVVEGVGAGELRAGMMTGDTVTVLACAAGRETVIVGSVTVDVEMATGPAVAGEPETGTMAGIVMVVAWGGKVTRVDQVIGVPPPPAGMVKVEKERGGGLTVMVERTPGAGVVKGEDGVSVMMIGVARVGRVISLGVRGVGVKIMAVPVPFRKTVELPRGKGVAKGMVDWEIGVVSDTSTTSGTVTVEGTAIIADGIMDTNEGTVRVIVVVAKVVSTAWTMVTVARGCPGAGEAGLMTVLIDDVGA